MSARRANRSAYQAKHKSGGSFTKGAGFSILIVPNDVNLKI